MFILIKMMFLEILQSLNFDLDPKIDLKLLSKIFLHISLVAVDGILLNYSNILLRIFKNIIIKCVINVFFFTPIMSNIK